MEQKDFDRLSQSDLQSEYKKIKTAKVTNAVLIGILIGIATYSAVVNGIGFFMLFPLFFVYLLFKNGKRISIQENEIKIRLHK